MGKELRHWFKMYLLDILCGMGFWDAIFGIYVGVLLLLK